MRYIQSNEFKKLIEDNNKFVLNCHISPDLDSVASVCAMSQYLKSIDKEFDIISTDVIPESYKYLPYADKIIQTKFEDIEFSKYDCWISLDSERLNQTGLSFKPKINIINIDHHPKNDIEGTVNVVNIESSSTCELLFELFNDIDFKIDKTLATTLLSGVVYDTNFFQQKNTTAVTHFVAYKLMELGADNNYINFKVKRSNSIGVIKLWGEFNKRLKFDKRYNFVWTAIPYKVYSKNLEDVSSTAEYSNMIARTVVGSKFSMVMSEKLPNNLTMSIRSRVPGFDVSLIAQEMDGGGHKDASGAVVKGLPFKEAVKVALKYARKHAKQNFVPEIPLD